MWCMWSLEHAQHLVEGRKSLTLTQCLNQIGKIYELIRGYPRFITASEWMPWRFPASSGRKFQRFCSSPVFVFYEGSFVDTSTQAKVHISDITFPAISADLRSKILRTELRTEAKGPLRPRVHLDCCHLEAPGNGERPIFRIDRQVSREKGKLDTVGPAIMLLRRFFQATRLRR